MRVASTSVVLAVIGVLMWLAVWQIDIEAEFGIHVILFCSQLWPFLVGAAAVGWIVHEALPDD